MKNIFRAGASALLLTVVLPVAAAPIAYVPNEKSGTLSLIDTTNDHVIAEIPVGKTPRGIAAITARNGRLIRRMPSAAPVKNSEEQFCTRGNQRPGTQVFYDER